MMYRIKLQHLGCTFEILMDAPSRQDVIRRIQALKAPVETKIIYIKDAILNPPDAG